MCLKSLKKFHQFLACELPRERTRRLVRQLLIQPESDFDLCQIAKRIGRQHLALNNGKVDFDLVEPTGVNWRVDKDCIRPFVA